MRFASRLFGARPVSQWFAGGGGGISRIQRGTISIALGSTSNTATIAAVDVTRTRLVYIGLTGPTDATVAPVAVRIALTNATTVTATVNTTSAAGARVIGFEVIEYRPGAIRAIRRGAVTTTAAASGTDTIAAVNVDKSTLDWLGFETNGAGTAPATAQVRLTLTDATTVTATSVGAFDRTVGYQVVEWY